MWFFIIFTKIMLLYIFDVGSALQCYHCSASSHQSCKESGSIQVCPKADSHCVTLSYEVYRESLNTSSVSQIYRKMCVISKDNSCERHCRFHRNIGNPCKVDCCSTNLCNMNKITSVYRRSPSSTAHSNICSFSFVIVSSIVLFLFVFKTNE